MNNEKIRVMLVEDDEPTAMRLKQMISAAPDMEVCAVCGTAEEAPGAAVRHEPHVAIIDQRLPGASGVTCIAGIREASRETQCLMLTTEEDPDVLFSAICAGAVGHLVKVRDTARIVEAIRDTAKGESVIAPSLASKLVGFFKRAHCKDLELGLTAREEEVLQRVRRGDPNKIIGSDLGIAESTVKKHVNAIYRKAAAANRHDMAENLRRSRGWAG